MTEFNKMQSVKRRFFSMRNGIIADTLRRNGSPFKIIFGLVLPQIEEIARDYGIDPQLAADLWANDTTRESMLMAPMLLDPNKVDQSTVIKMITEAPSAEIVDMLLHKLVRKMPQSYELATKMADSEKDILRYAAMRLLWHHLTSHTDEVKEFATKELDRNCRLTTQPAMAIVDEINWINDAD